MLSAAREHTAEEQAAAVSRAIWAPGRDRVLPAARRLGTLSGRMPRYAIALTVLISGPPPFISFSKIYTLLPSVSTGGFFLSSAMPIVALACMRLTRRWAPGPVSMGRWSGPVAYIARSGSWPKRSTSPGPGT